MFSWVSVIYPTIAQSSIMPWGFWVGDPKWNLIALSLDSSDGSTHLYHLLSNTCLETFRHYTIVINNVKNYNSFLWVKTMFWSMRIILMVRCDASAKSQLEKKSWRKTQTIPLSIITKTAILIIKRNRTVICFKSFKNIELYTVNYILFHSDYWIFTIVYNDKNYLILHITLD